MGTHDPQYVTRGPPLGCGIPPPCSPSYINKGNVLISVSERSSPFWDDTQRLLVITDVSGQPVLSSKGMQSCVNCLTIEDKSHRLFWNVGYYLPIGYVIAIVPAGPQIMVTYSEGCNEDKSRLSEARIKIYTVVEDEKHVIEWSRAEESCNTKRRRSY